MTDPTTLRQLRGAAELTVDAVDATVGAVAKVHEEIVGQVYAPLMLLGPLAAPVQLIAGLQGAITGGVYWTILASNRAVAVAAAVVFDGLERRE